MTELLFEKNHTCAVTGHRIMNSNFDANILRTVFTNLIKRDYNTFLIGMAIGFDTLCFKVLEELRKEYQIKIIACIPCPEQADRFNDLQKKEYEKLKESADDKILLSYKYTPDCMKKRNEFMVKNSSALVSYVRREKSGSKQTLKLAKKYALTVIEL